MKQHYFSVYSHSFYDKFQGKRKEYNMAKKRTFKGLAWNNNCHLLIAHLEIKWVDFCERIYSSTIFFLSLLNSANI